MRIIKDYDDYVWRSLQRGYTAKDIGISKMEEKWIKFKHKVDDIKHKVEDKSMSTFDKLKSKVKGIYSKWQSNSKKVMDGYIG